MEKPISNTVTCSSTYAEVFDFAGDYPRKDYTHIAVQVVGASVVDFTLDDGDSVAFSVVSNGSIAFDDFPLKGVLKAKDDGAGVKAYVNCW
jgi:hypothetical protein